MPLHPLGGCCCTHSTMPHRGKGGRDVHVPCAQLGGKTLPRASPLLLLILLYSSLKFAAQVGHLVDVCRHDRPAGWMDVVGAALLLLLGGSNALEPKLVVLEVIVVPYLPSGGRVPDREKQLLPLDLATWHVGHVDRILEAVSVILAYRLAISGGHLACRLPPVESEPDGDRFLEREVADDDGAFDQLCVR